MEGSMCPSFQITHDEVHSTRGRARVLSELFRGETVDSTDVEESLDLCLSCKACASECPVNVDMATYKSEFLHNRYSGKLRPRVHYLMGWLPLLSEIAHRLPVVPRIAGALMQSTVPAKIMAKVGGLDSSRPLISFAPESLQKWAKKRVPKYTGEPIVFWPDSFNSKLNTGPAQAAIEVLESLGFHVIVPDEFVCCGLTWHSTGQLDMTRRVLEHSAKVFEPYISQGLEVVAIEPSCTTMLQHDAVSQTRDPRVAELAKATKSFSEVVAPKIKQLVEEGRIKPQSGSVLTQVHCHEKSLGDPKQSALILDALGYDMEEIQTGCCGLAGNWGYEDGHAEMSFELGERELFPRVREHDGIVAADGFSCRTQVQQGTGKEAQHMAEIVRDVLVDADL